MERLKFLPFIIAVLVVGAIAGVLWMGERHAGYDQGFAVQPGDPAQRRGALVDEVIFTVESDPGRIVALIERGAHHLYGQGLDSASLFRLIQASSQVDYHLSRGTSVELTFNPARFEDGRLNPFRVPAIREAMNWLVDRRYVAEELFGGLAAPRYLPLNTAFPDYARLAATARELELHYRHDPARAEAVIGQELLKLGAKRLDGSWFYNDQPLRLTVLIRTDDNRERVGDYIANLLEDLGFAVQRLYRTAEEAARIWIAGDPALGQWHIYTGAWISPVINRDVGNDFNFYYTPRGRPEPLWQAYQPDPEFDQVADRLDRRDYTSVEQRQALMKDALRLAMQDSARVWLVDKQSIWPHAENIAVAVDLAGGVTGSALWPYTLRFKDGLGGRLVIGTPSMLTEPWNPVAGSNWIFDLMIMRALGDAAVLPDPFTGLFWPQRIQGATVTVAADAPVSRTLDWVTLEKTRQALEVPPDAWIAWEADAGRIITVGEKHPDGLTARSRAIIKYEDDYLKRRWHDGSRFSVADLVLPWILTFERADENSRLFDPGHLPRFLVYQRHFKGWRIIDTAPLTVEVYSDQVFLDAENLVANRLPALQPWHVLGLGIEAERRGELAFSTAQADRLGVEQISYVSGPSLEILRDYLAVAAKVGHLPFAKELAAWVEPEEITQRYTALTDWVAQRGHFWVDDGPFYLHSVRPLEGSLVLRRNQDFPDYADKWLHFSEPRIPELEIDAPLVVVLGEAMEATLNITFAGRPYPREEIDEVRYLLFDADDRLLNRGELEPLEPPEQGRWRLTLPVATLQRLGAGANSLEIAVTTTNVALPGFASHAFATVPAHDYGVGEPGEEPPQHGGQHD
ncbi:extracellular solute-binding protein family 5 [Desulfurivibrio alkaliphilus AHT 2]|uniref:Extracellular solute-binding protein family 5 n=2 Tax=Desulfurivibrio alkaliphilus TaxID=427923 RepID=D6Z0K1_DESAT|nr:ABC transporter substrate-binding protein [Desulfurivibrio alkaliphilus]ADH85230.1 extracellular solute-binding protein family 5 [Desulfurivibrio alkaliphilus AHT 2]